MRRTTLLGVSLLSLAIAAPAVAFAAEAAPDNSTEVGEVVITAGLDGGVQREMIGGSATVLTSDDIEQRGTKIVADVLRDVPGIAVSRSGCLGCTTAVRIRGAEANHTLVLVDGVNYASPVGREVDFSTLMAEDGARVEVLRGQQSALYGSEAIGGVVQYFTPDGRSSPGFRVRGEYGTNNTWQTNTSIGGASGAFDGIVSFTALASDGEPNTRTGTRDLGFWSYALSGKAHYDFNDSWRLIAVVRGDHSKTDFNAGSDIDGALTDTPGDFGKASNEVGKLELQGKVLDGRWTHSLSIEGMRSESDSFSFGSDFSSKGQRTKGQYVTAFTFGDEAMRSKLTGSIDYSQEKFSQVFDPVEHDLNNVGLVGVYDLTFGDATALSAAIRNDNNNRFESFTSYRLQATHTFSSGTRIRAAAGSGIQYPTQFELFGFSGTFLANPNLKPEKSEGWEVGIEQTLMDKMVLLGLTYFDNELSDKISSTGFPITTPINLTGKAHQKGVEAFAQAHLGAFAIDAAYTYLDSKDGTPPIQTVRRAKNVASGNLNWTSANEVFRVNLNVRYNGDQYDNRFPPVPPFSVRVKLPAYTLVGLSGEWKARDNLTVYARADNLFDEKYEEVWSYVAPGQQLSIGVKAHF